VSFFTHCYRLLIFFCKPRQYLFAIGKKKQSECDVWREERLLLRGEWHRLVSSCWFHVGGILFWRILIHTFPAVDVHLTSDSLKIVFNTKHIATGDKKIKLFVKNSVWFFGTTRKLCWDINLKEVSVKK